MQYNLKHGRFRLDTNKQTNTIDIWKLNTNLELELELEGEETNKRFF